MNILLDTHFLLWSLSDTSKLTTNEKKLILSKETNIIVSTVSLWEISLKYSLKRLKFENISIDDIIDAVKSSGYFLVELTPMEAITFYKLPAFQHKDPFDRMLIWQSIYNQYKLMTRDKKLNQYKNIGLHLVEL